MHVLLRTVYIYRYPLESKDDQRRCMRYTGSEHCTVCCVYSTHLPLSLREQRRPVKSWRCTCYCTMYTYRYSGDGCHVCLANVLYLLLLAISLCHTQTDRHQPVVTNKGTPPLFFNFSHTTFTQGNNIEIRDLEQIWRAPMFIFVSLCSKRRPRESNPDIQFFLIWHIVHETDRIR